MMTRTIARNRWSNEPLIRSQAVDRTKTKINFNKKGNPVLSGAVPIIQRKLTCPCDGGCPRCANAGIIQPKLTIGQPDDKYEREADRVADRVMRMPEGSLVNGHWSLGKREKESSLVQRQTDCSGPACTEEEEPVQTKPIGDQIQPLKGGGQPLPESTRAFFESRFGFDFSQVRVHTDARANESAKSVNAKAFTTGRDVVFESGQFQPETPAGKQLLAHELTHVVQQNGTIGKIQRACGRKAVGRPQGCTRGTPNFMPGAFFRFKRDCDDFAAGQEQALLQYAATLAPTDVIEIHGFASVDGSAVFNRNLACARAIRARELIATRGGIPRTRIVGIFNHGPTPGPKADRRSVVIRSTAHTGPTPLGFIVHSLNTTTGRLDDPVQNIPPGIVHWPLSFAVPSPITAAADVEVVGSAGDPCVQYQIGFLQTVDQQWLDIYYTGRQPAHGRSLIRYTVSLPIRDGDRNSMWYVNSANGRIRPAACNVHVNPQVSDYPTIFRLPKVRRNTVRRHPNYLDSVFRSISFLTTLAASGPGGVIPLRHFHWFYVMDIDFTPNYAAVNSNWPFTWNLNMAHSGPVKNGADSTIPIFTTATPTYNQLATAKTVEY